MKTFGNENFHLSGTLFLALVGFWVVLFGYSIHRALPYNPIHPPFQDRLYVNLLMPQGWKFFTRNPREEDLKIFKKDGDDKWSDALIGPNGSAGNYFGLKRDMRAQGIEMGILMASLDKDIWQTCAEKPEICVSSAPIRAELENVDKNPTLCGELGLVLQEPVPWAWSRAKKEVIIPSKFVRISVLCAQS